MKKLIVAIVLSMLSFTCFSQQKSFNTKTIGQWQLEKFPMHYSVTPTKTLTYKNAITGRLEGYEEFNQLGQTNGLKLTMCSDGIYPYSAIYVRKGVMVYSVTFFPNSKTANSITDYNDKEQKDGYRIHRTLKESGGFTEELEKYENDVLVELNGVKQAPVTIAYKDSLLNGKFKFENSRNWIIEGEAENGKLKKIKQTQEGLYFMCEITFLTDSIIVKEPYTSQEGFSIKKFPLITNPLITNSKNFCLKYGNYNGFPYLYLPKDFDIRDLEEIIKQHFYDPFETKAIFVDSLLDGEFQFREYKYTGSFQYNGVINVSGKAIKGNLESLRVQTIQINSYNGSIYTNKYVDYHFKDGKIVQNDFVPELPNDPVATKTLILEYPVLLTNSKLLGGTYSYDYNNTNNVLSVPIKRKTNLENNKYGYMYFSPTTFDIENLLSILTTKTKKPVETQVTITNGFLEGAFDFKEDRFQFTGIANSGLIQSMKIKYDFETSKTIVAPGSNWNGRSINYDIIEIVLNAESYKATYILSSDNQKIYEEEIPFTKNKKITTSKNLSTYDNFIVCGTYQELKDTLLAMKYIIKKE